MSWHSHPHRLHYSPITIFLAIVSDAVYNYYSDRMKNYRFIQLGWHLLFVHESWSSSMAHWTAFRMPCVSMFVLSIIYGDLTGARLDWNWAMRLHKYNHVNVISINIYIFTIFTIKYAVLVVVVDPFNIWIYHRLTYNLNNIGTLSRCFWRKDAKVETIFFHSA